MNVLAALLFWTAVRDGEIVRVVPINRLSVLFVIFFSWFFFRKQEAVTLRVVKGGVISVVGAFIIVSGRYPPLPHLPTGGAVATGEETCDNRIFLPFLSR